MYFNAGKGDDSRHRRRSALARHADDRPRRARRVFRRSITSSASRPIRSRRLRSTARRRSTRSGWTSRVRRDRARGGVRPSATSAATTFSPASTSVASPPSRRATSSSATSSRHCGTRINLSVQNLFSCRGGTSTPNGWIASGRTAIYTARTRVRVRQEARRDAQLTRDRDDGVPRFPLRSVRRPSERRLTARAPRTVSPGSSRGRLRRAPAHLPRALRGG